MHGILVQLPLPKGINAARVLEAIAPHKDVDGFHPINVGLLSIGETSRALIPCTPAGAMILIDRPASGSGATLAGHGGGGHRPLEHRRQADGATAARAPLHGDDRPFAQRDLPAVARRAEILVAAVGRPELVRGDWIKPGAIVIDVGVNRIPAEGLDAAGRPQTRLVGDVAYAEAAARAGAITPVPGGVGPMTIAMLMANALIAACRANGLPEPKF